PRIGRAGGGERAGSPAPLPGIEILAFLHDVPHVVLVVAGGVAGLLVVDEGVEGLAIVRPLQRAVLALDDGQVADRLVLRRRLRRRPVLGAFAVAVGLALGVLVVGIERHALGIGENGSGRGLHGLERPIVLGRRANDEGERERRRRRQYEPAESIH